MTETAFLTLGVAAFWREPKMLLLTSII